MFKGAYEGDEALKIFITGGTSFFGGHLVKQLCGLGCELTLLVRRPHHWSWLQEVPRIKIVPGSLETIEPWSNELVGHQVLIHNALLWDEEPSELEMHDLRASALLLEAAGKAGISQVIYTSSAAVHRPWKTLMREHDHLMPETTYGAVKAAAEGFLSALGHRHGFKWTVLRPGAIVGPPAFPGAAFRIDARINAMAAMARRGEEIRISSDDSRQFVGAKELAKVFSSVIEGGCQNQTYVTVDPFMTEWEQIARRLCSLLGSSSNVIVQGPRVHEQRFDVSRLQQDLDISLNSREELEQALTWLACPGQF